MVLLLYCYTLFVSLRKFLRPVIQAEGWRLKHAETCYACYAFPPSGASGAPTFKDQSLHRIHAVCLMRSHQSHGSHPLGHHLGHQWTHRIHDFKSLKFFKYVFWVFCLLLVILFWDILVKIPSSSNVLILCQLDAVHQLLSLPRCWKSQSICCQKIRPLHRATDVESWSAGTLIEIWLWNAVNNKLI